MKDGLLGKLALRQGAGQLALAFLAGDQGDPGGVDRLQGEVGAGTVGVKVRPKTVAALDRKSVV